METNQIKDFDEIMTHTSEQSKTASASGSAEKRLVAAPKWVRPSSFHFLDFDRSVFETVVFYLVHCASQLRVNFSTGSSTSLALAF